MAYGKEISELVRRRFDLLLVQNTSEKERRREEIYSKIPRIAEIVSAIAGEGLALTKAALDGSATDAETERVQKVITAYIAEKERLMGEHGYSADYCENVYRCPLCKDKGHTGDKPCRCFLQEQRAEAYKQSGLSELLGTQNFDTFSLDYYPKEGAEGVSPYAQMKMVLEACKEFALAFPEGKDKGLLLYGSPGLGKTFLSSCIAKAVLDRGYGVIYQTAPRIFSILEDRRFNKENAAAHLSVDGLYACDLLIVDDLGSEFTTKFTVAALFDMINTRMVQGKKTVISSNLSPKAINDQYSTRVISRLYEFKLLQCLGADIRLVQKGL